MADEEKGEEEKPEAEEKTGATVHFGKPKLKPTINIVKPKRGWKKITEKKPIGKTK